MAAVNSLIAVILCSVVGAFTGLMLGGLIPDWLMALLAGLFATIIAGAVRNMRISQLMFIYDALAIERGIPIRLIACSALASVFGSLAAVGVAAMSEATSRVLIGTMAGLFSGILMVMLMVVYTTTQGQGPGRHS